MARLLAFVLSAWTLAGIAAPAPWYQWRSLATGGDACAQTSPGEGWKRLDGPYIDAACKRRLRIVGL